MKKEQLFPSKYMKGIDLNGKPWTFKIRSIQMEPIRSKEGTVEKKAIVYFNGPKKGLILTPTIFDQIIQATGQDDTDSWPGHLITIYPTTVYAFGANHLVIRVRPIESSSNETPEALTHDDDELPEVAIDELE